MARGIGKCLGCEEIKFLTSHHVTPKSVDKKSKEKVLVCRECHNKIYQAFQHRELALMGAKIIGWLSKESKTYVLKAKESKPQKVKQRKYKKSQNHMKKINLREEIAKQVFDAWQLQKLTK